MIGLPTAVVTTVHVVIVAGEVDTGVLLFELPRTATWVVVAAAWGFLRGEPAPGPAEAPPAFTRVDGAPHAPLYLAARGGVHAALDGGVECRISALLLPPLSGVDLVGSGGAMDGLASGGESQNFVSMATRDEIGAARLEFRSSWTCDADWPATWCTVPAASRTHAAAPSSVPLGDILRGVGTAVATPSTLTATCAPATSKMAVDGGGVVLVAGAFVTAA